MAALYIIIAVLVGAVIILYIYSREKPKDLEKEIGRLRKSIVSEGLNFEQIEYRIASLKEDIAGKKKLISSGKMTGSDMEKYLEETEDRLDGILGELLSGKPIK